MSRSFSQLTSTETNRPKALFVNFSERIIDSPRQNRQMNALSETYDIYTIGIGPSPSASILHVDVSYKPRIKVRNIDLFALPRVVVFMLASYLRLFSVANYFQATSGNTLSPRAIIKLIPDKHYEIVCGRDLHSVWLCRKVFSKNLIWIDLPDFTPLQQEHNSLWKRTWGKYFHHTALSLQKEKIVTTTVSEGLAKKFQSDYGITPQLLLNVPPFHEKKAEKIKTTTETLRLVHSGAAIRSRGLHLMIEAVHALNNVALDMILLPTDKEYVEELNQIAQTTSQIKIRLPVERNQIVSDLADYDCALIVIAPSNFNYAHCLPNKFFEAIQARIPIISGPTPDMKQIIEKHDIGIVSSDFTVKSISDAIKTMIVIRNEGGLKAFEAGLDECARTYCASEDDKQLRKIITDALANVRNE